jgi:hypothetical protein
MQTKKEGNKYSNCKTLEFNTISFRKKNSSNLKNSNKDNKNSFSNNCYKVLTLNTYKIKLDKNKKKNTCNKTSELKCFKN